MVAVWSYPEKGKMLSKMQGHVVWKVWYNAFVLSMFMIYGCNVCVCELVYCVVCWIEENKSLNVVEDMECKFSCCEVEVLMNFHLEKQTLL